MDNYKIPLKSVKISQKQQHLCLILKIFQIASWKKETAAHFSSSLYEHKLTKKNLLNVSCIENMRNSFKVKKIPKFQFFSRKKNRHIFHSEWKSVETVSYSEKLKQTRQNWAQNQLKLGKKVFKKFKKIDWIKIKTFTGSKIRQK